MASPLAEVLSGAGIRVSEAEFARLVAGVLSELGPPAADDPGAALSPDDLAALTAVGADTSPRRRRETDPRATAAAGYAGVLAASVPVAEVARRLGIDTSRVRHRLLRRQLVGIRRTDGWHLPKWQFGADGRPVPGIERVLRALPDRVHPVVVTRFFLTPQPELVVDGAPATPRDWLAGGGDPAAVAPLAASLDVLV